MIFPGRYEFGSYRFLTISKRTKVCIIREYLMVMTVVMGFWNFLEQGQLGSSSFVVDGSSTCC